MARHQSVAAAYIIFEKAGEYLLSRRQNTERFNGEFSLPAGHVDSGESVVLGAVREAKEEVGLVVKPEDLKLVHILDRNAPDFHRLDFFFHCTEWEGGAVNCEPEKCSELKWVSKAEVKNEVAEYLKQVFEKIEEPGTFYSEQDWS